MDSSRMPADGKLELTAGTGWQRSADSRETRHVAEAKYLLREITARGAGVGIVGGLDFSGANPGGGVRRTGSYAYVAISMAIFSERLLLHGNPGWRHERGDRAAGNGGSHAMTWALGADVPIPRMEDHLELYGELFGEQGGRPEFQLGGRGAAILDRLYFELSWGGHTDPALRGAGWTLGMTWSPPPFF